MRKAMTIGELAKAGNVGVETIRYYQRRGLLQKPSRPSVGRRHYSEVALDRIGFIRRAQFLGFTLDEITELLAVADAGDNAAAAQALAQRKLEELTGRVDELNRMRRELRKHLAGNGQALLRALRGEG